MAWHCSGASNTALVENLSREGLISDARVKAAFLRVDRADYTPHARSAYHDSPQYIGHGATISAPHMHAMAMESLVSHLTPTSTVTAPRALDIGSGSGYLTHIMGELVGEKGLVVGLEHIPELRELGEQNLRKSKEGKALFDAGRVKFRVGDGRLGLDEPSTEGNSKWHVIHVGAAAKELHAPLLEQLSSPGRMFVPVEDGGGGAQAVWTVDKDEAGNITKNRLCAVRYVKLTDAQSSLSGYHG